MKDTAPGRWRGGMMLNRFERIALTVLTLEALIAAVAVIVRVS